MFTVLYRRADGSETYHECEMVTRLATGQGSVPPLGKIVLGGITSSIVPGDALEIELEAPFGAVFVMNRFGATVQKWLAAEKPPG